MSAERFCPSCLKFADAFGPGPNGRPDASCPSCGSLERDRFLATLLQGMAPYVVSAAAVLDVAPGRATTRVLRRMQVRRHVRMDLDPAADGRAIDVQASLTDLPFADGSFDLILCYHVLEHVPDDAAAMAEIARVLAPGGIALVQVPWRPGTVTDEDPSAPVEERLRRFGQADHVRYYGDDFETRLTAAGLGVWRLEPKDVLTPPLVALLNVRAGEPVWLLRRDAAAEVHVPARVPVQLHLATLLERRSRERIGELQRELRAARRESALWQRRYEKLRGRLPLRAAAAAAGVVQRATRRG